jgi:DNA-binding beta-propeller fold protein YncE
MIERLAPCFVMALASCSPSTPPAAAAPPVVVMTPVGVAPPASPSSQSFPFPNATAPASFDYLAIDRATSRVFVPITNAGSVYAFDIAAHTFAAAAGFETAARESHGKTRIAGPSAVAVGDGVLYVGDRATNAVCLVNAKSLARGACLTLPSPTDGVAYVASAKEVWVTTPRDHSLTVLDASREGALTAKTTITTPGDPEGYAVDEPRGLFFTNLEDKGGTLVIDVKTHAVRATWNAGCGEDGPRGIAVDSARSLVFVACTDHVQVLDAARDGAKLGRIETGAGVDNLDYVASKSLLVAAAGKAAQITIARIGDHGTVDHVTTIPTAPGARNAVADASGRAYVVDPANARLLVVGE